MLAKTFYNRLPKHKIELVDGKTLISGGLEVSRMVLDSILQSYGAQYIKSLVEPELIQEACIESFGKKTKYKGDTAPLVVETTNIHVARIASELRMNLFALDYFGVWGGDLVVKLGDDALTPDIYVNRNQHDPRQHEYFFYGAPDLIIEVLHPATKAFDAGLRLEQYMTAVVPEIWLIDPVSESIMTYCHDESSYTVQEIKEGEKLDCQVLPGLTLFPAKLWEIINAPWQGVRDLVNYHKNTLKDKPDLARVKDTEGLEYSHFRLPFAPDVRLMPTPITFEQFISWAPEAKFEWMDDRPHIGGGTDTNLHLTGLLLMTFGLTEVVGMLPAEAWYNYLK